MKSLENAPLDVPSRRLGPPTRLRTCCLQLLVQLLDGLLQGRLARVQKLIRRLDVLPEIHRIQLEINWNSMVFGRGEWLKSLS